jgi:hypothetical protein
VLSKNPSAGLISIGCLILFCQVLLGVCVGSGAPIYVQSDQASGQAGERLLISIADDATGRRPAGSLALLAIPETGSPRIKSVKIRSRGRLEDAPFESVAQGFIRDQRVLAIRIGEADGSAHGGRSTWTEAAVDIEMIAGTDSQQAGIRQARSNSHFDIVYQSLLENYADAGRCRRHSDAPFDHDPGGFPASDPEHSDYLIIVADAVAGPAIDQLVQLRAGQGFAPYALPTSEIAADLSDSTLKDFIRCMYQTGKRAPVYVVLIGDAEADDPGENLIPTHQPSDNESADLVGDQWYACVSGNDPFADLFIGRIPARDYQEVSDYIAKVREYESSLTVNPWDNNCLFLYRDEFKGDSVYRYLAENCVPEAWEQHAIRFNTCAEFKPELIAALESPSYALVNVISGSRPGHLLSMCFSEEDVDDLTNQGRYPFILYMSCHAGEFDQEPSYYRAVAPFLTLAAGKGAIGGLAPIRMISPPETEFRITFSEVFMDELLSRQVPTAGQLATIARIRYQLLEPWYWSSAYQMQLIGDPGIRFHLAHMTDEVRDPVTGYDSIAGTGAATCDLTGEGIPDLLVGYLTYADHPIIPDAYERFARLELYTNINAESVWTDPTSDLTIQIPPLEEHAPVTGGLGISVGDLAGGEAQAMSSYPSPALRFSSQPDGEPDLAILAARDEPRNGFLLKIGQNLQLFGQDSLECESWSDWIDLPSSLFDSLDAGCRGIGADLRDVDSDGMMDLVIVQSAGPSEPFKYLIGKNLTTDGQVEQWVKRWSDASLPITETGISCAIADVNGDGNQDVAVWLAAPTDSGGSLWSTAGLSLDGSTGLVSQWTEYCEDLENHLSLPPAGSGAARADMDFDSHEDLIVVAPGQDSGEMSLQYRIIRGFHQPFQASGFEHYDTPALQHRWMCLYANMCIDSARTAEYDGSTPPRQGQRYFKISGIDYSQDQSEGRVTIFDGSFLVERNMCISYWLYVSESPDALGHIGLDLVLETEMASDLGSISDQYGRPMKPHKRRVPHGSWQRYIYDLTPIAGRTVNEIVIAYRDSVPTEEGALTAYVDDVRLLVVPSALNPDNCLLEACSDSLLFCPSDCFDALSFDLTARDSLGTALPGLDPDNFYVVISNLDKYEGGFCHCEGSRTWTPQVPTDDDGITRVQLWGEIGGCALIEAIGYICGREIGRDTVLTRSTDMDASGCVDLPDYITFAENYLTDYWCADFQNPASSGVDLADFILFSWHYDHCCLDVPPQAPPGNGVGLRLFLRCEDTPARTNGLGRCSLVLEGIRGYRGMEIELLLPDGVRFEGWEPNSELELAPTIGPFVSEDGRRMMLATATRRPYQVDGLSPGRFIISGQSGEQTIFAHAQVAGAQMDISSYAGSIGPIIAGPDPVADFSMEPNPFSTEVRISFAVPIQEHVCITVYDITGRLVGTISDEACKPGTNTFRWEGLDKEGHRVASGIYFVRLDSGGLTITKKLTVLR